MMLLPLTSEGRSVIRNTALKPDLSCERRFTKMFVTVAVFSSGLPRLPGRPFWELELFKGFLEAILEAILRPSPSMQSPLHRVAASP